jgi:hypothetical protein
VIEQCRFTSSQKTGQDADRNHFALSHKKRATVKVALQNTKNNELNQTRFFQRQERSILGNGLERTLA